MRGDDVLVLAAVGQDGGQPLLLGQAEEPLGAQQHVQGREDRPARDLGHLLDAERHVAAVLAPRGIDQPQIRAVEQQADGHLGLAQQPLEAGLRAGLPVPVVLGGYLVEVLPQRYASGRASSKDGPRPWARIHWTAQVGRSVSLYSGSDDFQCLEQPAYSLAG